jgi:hypothetical protein
MLPAMETQITYDPETGLFNLPRKGLSFGLKRPDGYYEIKVKRKGWLAHRLAWYLYYGENPVGFVDHINMDKSDNRIKNLRTLSPKDSQFNIPARFRLGTGIRPSGRKWTAHLKVNGKQMHLGTFKTKELAQKARWGAEDAHWPGMRESTK